MVSRPSACVSKPRADLRNASSIASREPLRKSREGPKRFWKCLHHRCNGPKVFFSICNGVANARKFFVRLATVLQTPKSFSWDLQRCCKRQKVFRETCNSVANARKFFVGLATVLQTPESFSWDLQRCCKRQKVFRGTCNSVASISKNTLTVIARYQRRFPRRRTLILSSDSRVKRPSPQLLTVGLTIRRRPPLEVQRRKSIVALSLWDNNIYYIRGHEHSLL